jgi:hypothetical protein
MPKTCKHQNCSNFVFSKSYCKFHQYIIADKTIKPKKQKPIKKFSAKMRIKVAEYSELRKEFLAQEPLCRAKLEGCTKIATDIHHMQGRGKNLLNISTWAPVCRNCHRFIEENPKKAKELNFSQSRIKK